MEEVGRNIQVIFWEDAHLQMGHTADDMFDPCVDIFGRMGLLGQLVKLTNEAVADAQEAEGR